MKNYKKAFTLVEMLIVVVIIGILSSALLPRLQGAQSAARDAARKSDLSQLGSAILQYYNNRGEYPDGSGASAKGGNLINVDAIGEKLMKTVELSSVPTDPNRSNVIKWKGTNNTENTLSGGQYGYFMAKKNSIDDQGYVLVARAETEGGANYLATMTLSGDLSNFKACTKFGSVETDGCSETTGVPGSTFTGFCCYGAKSDFLYLYVF